MNLLGDAHHTSQRQRRLLGRCGEHGGGGGDPSPQPPAIAHPFDAPVRVPVVVGRWSADGGTIERRPGETDDGASTVSSAIDRDFHESSTATSVPRVTE